MRRLSAILLVVLLLTPAANAVIVSVDPSGGPWQGFMNVFELPVNGGGYVFGSPWAPADLVATFDDPNNKLTLSPNSVGDPNPFWYIGGGGPGAPGNKIMDANLYQEYTDVYNGQTVTFEGAVISNTFTQAHVAKIFIRDFAPDFSSFNEVSVPIAPGPFSISLNADAGAGRHVQYGFQVVGENVWATDVGPFGNAMIRTIPEPGTLALLGFAGLAIFRRRR
jgi:hypothetical protein